MANKALLLSLLLLTGCCQIGTRDPFEVIDRPLDPSNVTTSYVSVKWNLDRSVLWMVNFNLTRLYDQITH